MEDSICGLLAPSTSLHGRRVLGSPSQLLVVVGSSLWQEVINEEVHIHLK